MPRSHVLWQQSALRIHNQIFASVSMALQYGCADGRTSRCRPPRSASTPLFNRCSTKSPVYNRRAAVGQLLYNFETTNSDLCTYQPLCAHGGSIIERRGRLQLLCRALVSADFSIPSCIPCSPVLTTHCTAAMCRLSCLMLILLLVAGCTHAQRRSMLQGGAGNIG